MVAIPKQLANLTKEGITKACTQVFRGSLSPRDNWAEEPVWCAAIIYTTLCCYLAQVCNSPSVHIKRFPAQLLAGHKKVWTLFKVKLLFTDQLISFYLI